MDEIEDAASCLLGQPVSALQSIGELRPADPDHGGKILLADAEGGHEEADLRDDGRRQDAAGIAFRRLGDGRRREIDDGIVSMTRTGSGTAPGASARAGKAISSKRASAPSLAVSSSLTPGTIRGSQITTFRLAPAAWR